MIGNLQDDLSIIANPTFYIGFVRRATLHEDISFMVFTSNPFVIQMSSLSIGHMKGIS